MVCSQLLLSVFVLFYFPASVEDIIPDISPAVIFVAVSGGLFLCLVIIGLLFLPVLRKNLNNPNWCMHKDWRLPCRASWELENSVLFTVFVILQTCSHWKTKEGLLHWTDVVCLLKPQFRKVYLTLRFLSMCTIFTLSKILLPRKRILRSWKTMFLHKI